MTLQPFIKHADYSNNPRRGGQARKSNAEKNKLSATDRAAHDWYRFVLSYPPHLVRDYLERFGCAVGDCVLDPFCGTGTTPVECKKLGIASVGMEPHPMSHFAGMVKVDWTVDANLLRQTSEIIAESTHRALLKDGITDDYNLTIRETRASYMDAPDLRTLAPDAFGLLLTNSISPLPLHKALTLRDSIDRLAPVSCRALCRLALAKALVDAIGNLSFGPEVGVGAIKTDAQVIAPWLANIGAMAADLEELRGRADVPSLVQMADARVPEQVLSPNSISAVITSPPYPNEKDYTRTTRLESVVLGFINNKQELQALKRGLMRSNTRNVYKGDGDDAWIADFPRILQLANEIEARRIEMGKTSGFERLYARVTKLYFGGMARHLAGLRPFLKPGAQLAYVVGDQASYLRIMIRTGHILAEIAATLGYEVVNIDLFRTRLATATKEQLREEVLVLRWPG